MPYHITTDEANGIVQVTVSGIISYEEEQAARLEAARILNEKHFDRLLVDLTELKSGGKVTTTECFDFGSTYSKSGFPPNIHIAHVLPIDPVKKSNIEFVTTVALNRGIFAKEFNSIDAASAWLTRK
jgi:hypothetical protein